VGKPVDDISLRIVDHEIQVAGAHVNGGYLDPPMTRKQDPRGRHDLAPYRRCGGARCGRSALAVRPDRIRGGRSRCAAFSPSPSRSRRAAGQGVRQCALVEVSGAPCLVIEGDASMIGALGRPCGGSRHRRCARSYRRFPWTAAMPPRSTGRPWPDGWDRRRSAPIPCFDKRLPGPLSPGGIWWLSWS
jgi:hypothetical protein